ncbi:hypothetical protein [Dyella tabacisoli]|uniref:Holin n=1 Tax=Dyella tabacisoli TaxID=2282381 RepID=A0A369UUZ9_9GAMM|nr:hypothetical protein [Dyella tabacisoli]RDD83430.1 hypothetical protein DVJ77_02280 [Dyella tabacisoli]
MDDFKLIDVWVLLAGVGGAVLPVALRRQTHFSDALVQILCGVLTAAFLAPAVITYFFPQATPSVQSALTFLIGCFGPNFAVLTQRWMDSNGEALIARLFGRFFDPGRGRDDRA